MKTFKDLEFKNKWTDKQLEVNKLLSDFVTPLQAVLFFDNGYGVSVITGHGAYADAEHPYEIGVLTGDEKKNLL